MTPNNDPRSLLLDHDGHALVIGGPGSGKTTLALAKAVLRINAGLKVGQKIMFLSFSRAAVARLFEAAKEGISKENVELISLQTFHSFFWDLVKTHGYLLGVPKKLSILLPQDERALSGFKKAKPQDPNWLAWLNERQRLFVEDGRVPFDSFAPAAANLLAKSAHIRRMVSNKYPLIIVDEAQDTGPEAWSCIQILSHKSQIICLADMDQQIFDHLPGIGPERTLEIKASLSPLEINLGSENFRSPGTEIADFGSDILAGKIRGAPYLGVSKLIYSTKNLDLNKILRRSIGVLHRRFKKQTGSRIKSIAVLTQSGLSAAKISAALNSGEKPVRHRLHFDESQAMLSARFAAFLLEPKSKANRIIEAAIALDLLADIVKAAGLIKAKKLKIWAESLRKGKVPRSDLIKSIFMLLANLDAVNFSGNPSRDWLLVKNMLREIGSRDFVDVVQHLEYLVAFNHGKRISANLATEWSRDGQYTNARLALDSAISQDQILDGIDDHDGLQIMTIHKSKGKQFDAVILFRERRFDKDVGGFVSSFVWRGDNPPYERSRKILRVAITRARFHVMLLEAAFPRCPILAGHLL